MPDEIVVHGSKGGLARRDALDANELKAIARKGAEARWGSDLPRATHDGVLSLGSALLIAAVLPNGTRLLGQATVLTAIGRSRSPKAGTGILSHVDDLPFFLSAEVLRPFISEELVQSTTPIHFRLKNGRKTVGYDALMLPRVCNVYLEFRDFIQDELVSEDKSRERQAKAHLKKYGHIIRACDLLMRGIAMGGIIALVDGATGYQNDRILEEIKSLVIQAYVTPKLQVWTETFKPEFFQLAYKILGWEYRPGQIKHPGYMGKFINKYIYDGLPEGVADELKKTLPKNEKGNRRAKLWQALTEHTGNPHLDQQLRDTMLLMDVTDSKADFDALWQRKFGRQKRLPLEIAKQLSLRN
jgi:P63C domain